MKLESKIPDGPLAEKWTKHKFNLKLVNPANKRKMHVIVVGTGLAGGAARVFRIGIPEGAESAHGRQARETVAEALYPAALVVNGDHQPRPQGADRRGEGAQLGRVRVISGKQDHAADEGMLQDVPLFGGQFEAGHVEHDRAGRAMGKLHGCSMTAKAST